MEASASAAAQAIAAQVAAHNCQYFVLSPRQSLESPAKRPSTSGDENADHNVAAQLNRKLQDGQASQKVLAPKTPSSSKTPAKTPRPAKTPGSARSVLTTPRYDQQPCLRPSTPTRTKESHSRNPSPASRSLQQSARSLPMTPDRCNQSDAMSDSESCDIANMSVYSEMSHMSQESRFSRLSRRSTVRKQLGSKELEQMQVEEKRREVRDMIKRNQVNCRKALLATDVASAGRALRPTKVTMPKEFGLSTALRTPRTPRSPDTISELGEDDGPTWNTSLRRAQTPLSARGPTPMRQWRPELTVPKGPELRTTRRLSCSGSRRSLSCPPQEADAAAGAGEGHARPTRACTPEKRRQEVYKAAAQLERNKVANAAKKITASASFAPPARAPASARPAGAGSSSASASGSGTTAQERAQRARMLAQQRKDEEAQAAKEKHCVFKRAAAAAGSSAAAAPAARQSTKRLVKPPTRTASEKKLQGLTPRGDLQHSSSADSIGLASGTSSVKERLGKAPPTRRASFGSTVARPCLSTTSPRIATPRER